MKKAPWSPRILSVILTGVAVSFPLQIVLLYDHRFSELGAILSKLTGMNLLTMLACSISAVLLWNVSRFSLPALTITAAVVAWNNYLVGYVAYDYTMTSTLMGTGLFLLTYTFLLHPDAKRALLQPGSRWWLQAERRIMALPTEVHTIHGDFGILKTFDISESGAFIGCDDDSLQMFQVGDHCSISIRISDYKRVKCVAKVVRLSKGVGRYPKGIGLHFEDVEAKDARYLRSFLKEMPSFDLH